MPFLSTIVSSSNSSSASYTHLTKTLSSSSSRIPEFDSPEFLGPEYYKLKTTLENAGIIPKKLPMFSLTSDTYSGMHPIVLISILKQALAAFPGHTPAYENEMTKSTAQFLRTFIGDPKAIISHFASTSGSNSALRRLFVTEGSVMLCANRSHRETFEAGEPKQLLRTEGIPSPREIDAMIEKLKIDGHKAPISLLWLDFPTEGYADAPEHIHSLVEHAHKKELPVGIDFERCWTILESWGMPLSKLITKIGPDMVSFGSQKNGGPLLSFSAILDTSFLRKSRGDRSMLQRQFEAIQKSMGHLMAKTQYFGDFEAFAEPRGNKPSYLVQCARRSRLLAQDFRDCVSAACPDLKWMPKGQIPNLSYVKVNAEFVKALKAKSPYYQDLFITLGGWLRIVHSWDLPVSIAEQFKKNDLILGMDAERLANVVARTGISFADFTWRAGVNILGMSTQKSGGPTSSLVVYFNKADGKKQFRRLIAISKEDGNLLVKIRYCGSYDLMLRAGTESLLVANARLANDRADEVYEALKGMGIPVHKPVANLLFCKFSKEFLQYFHQSPEYKKLSPDRTGETRLAFPWSMPRANIRRLITDLREAANRTKDKPAKPKAITA